MNRRERKAAFDRMKKTNYVFSLFLDGGQIRIVTVGDEDTLAAMFAKMVHSNDKIAAFFENVGSEVEQLVKEDEEKEV